MKINLDTLQAATIGCMDRFELLEVRPQDMLALIRVARAARDYWKTYAIDEADKLQDIMEAERILQEALKEIE